MQSLRELTGGKQMRLPWWGVLCVILGALPLVYLFDHFGKFALALPTLDSIGMIAIAVAYRWQMRAQAWFWITVTIIVALHVALILIVPWTTKWVPAAVIVPLGLADLYVMLSIFSGVGKLVARRKVSVRG